MRMIALSALLAVACFGCGGGSSGGGDDDVPADSSNNPPPADGPNNPPPASALGTTCTPDQANPQGSCPTGFQCLNLMGGTNAWCSKTCTGPTDTSCETGYDGPGKAACTLQVGPQGGPTENFCGVICQDMTQGNLICPANVCDGTCPGSLACSGDLVGSINGGAQMTIGQVCE